MALAAEPNPVGAWYAVATLEAVTPTRWMLKISMTPRIGVEPRQDRYVRDVDEACELLRQWFTQVVATTR